MRGKNENLFILLCFNVLSTVPRENRFIYNIVCKHYFWHSN